MLEPFCHLLDGQRLVAPGHRLRGAGKPQVTTGRYPTWSGPSSDDDTRWAAVDALAQIGAASALQPLSKLLRDPREEVRLEVLQAFSRFSDQRLLPVIRSVRERDPSADGPGTGSGGSKDPDAPSASSLDETDDSTTRRRWTSRGFDQPSRQAALEDSGNGGQRSPPHGRRTSDGAPRR